MKKEFYIGQPLIVKRTGEKVVFTCDDGDTELPCNVVKNDGHFYQDYYGYEQVEPSTEFKLSEIIAGLEQRYFEVGTEFRRFNTERTITVADGDNGLYLVRPRELSFPTTKDINSTWTLVEPRKEMSLEEIEAELGYKIKLKDKID